MPLATPEQFFQYMGQVPQPGAMATVENIVKRASAMVERFLGFTFAEYPGSPSTLVVAHSGGSVLYLPAHEAGSITAVTDNVGSTVLSTAYAEDHNGNLYFTVNNYPYGATGAPLGLFAPGRYTVTAKWGYGPTVPEDVVEVVLELAVNIWRGKDRGMWTDYVGVQGSGELLFTGGLTNQQRAILTQVRRDLRNPGRVLA